MTFPIRAAALRSLDKNYTQSGRKGHAISCSPGWTGGIVGAVANASTSWAQCYQRAGELCGAGGTRFLSRLVRLVSIRKVVRT